MREAYRHLRREDRDVIYRMNKAGKTQTEIAQAIGFSQSTVSKELQRNKGMRGYRTKQAQCLAQQRQCSKASRPRKLTGKLLAEVEGRLRLNHSPEQISGALKLQGVLVSHETIYRHILKDKLGGGSLHLKLRINSKRRHRRRNGASRSKIPKRRGIEHRPAVVDKRQRYGDWEADLVEGAKGSGFILSLYERKSRLGLLAKLEDKGSEATSQGIIRLLEGYQVRTITYDNGLEFSRHEEVSSALGAQGYFCNPYHSWEKGGVENYNGLLRQYFPKGSDFSQISLEQLQQVEAEINQRPRKCLGFRAPSDKQHKLAA